MVQKLTNSQPSRHHETKTNNLERELSAASDAHCGAFVPYLYAIVLYLLSIYFYVHKYPTILYLRAKFQLQIYCISLDETKSRAVARKPRDAAAVLFGLMFADNIHYKFKSSHLRKRSVRKP